jgi:xylulokinase
VIKDCIVAFDSGTQSVKTIIFDKYGNILGEGHAPHTIFINEFRAEQDPNEWWSAFCTSFKIALKNSRIPVERIAAVGLTTQRETMCAVDFEGKPLIPAQVWYDTRAIKQVRKIKDEFGSERYMKIAGRMPDTTWWIFKVMWIKDNEKDVFNSTYKFLTVHGFFIYKLTGEFKDSYASPTGILDMTTMNYSTELMKAFDIPREKLCDLVQPGTIIGYVSSEAAKETGLIEGTPVVAGAGDQQAGALGAGVITPNSAYLNLGTSVVLGVVEKYYKYNSNFIVREGCAPNTWNFEALINSGYWMITWFKENFAQTEINAALSLKLHPEVILDLEAEKIPAGSHGLIVQPYWLGVRQPYWDEKAKGSVIGWSSIHTRAHFYRAIIEGLAYEIKLNLELFEETLKNSVDDVVTFGGGAKSSLSCQIIADVLNKPIRLTGTHEATTLGAAILAAFGVKLYSSIEEAVKTMTKISMRFDPKRENVDVYLKLFKVYKRLYPTVRSLMKDL